MNYLEFTTAITAVANAIACNLSEEELALMASIFVQIGDTLATIATKRAICQSKSKEQKN